MLRPAAVLRRGGLGTGGWVAPTLVNGYKQSGPTREQYHDPRNMQRKGETSSWWITRVVMENTFEARESDDRMYGGENTAARANMRNELRYMDRRMATPFHPELTMNVLKNAMFYTAPNKKRFNNDYLDGRLVGLCMLSETDRCMRFIEQLKRFTAEHENDFIPIVLPMTKFECEDLALSNGMCYLSHSNGAMLVKRDTGQNTGRMLPLPRLIIVEVTTGFQITNSGFTAIVVNPETCFSAWLNGDSGVNWTDYFLSMTY